LVSMLARSLKDDDYSQESSVEVLDEFYC